MLFLAKHLTPQIWEHIPSLRHHLNCVVYFHGFCSFEQGLVSTFEISDVHKYVIH